MNIRKITVAIFAVIAIAGAIGWTTLAGRKILAVAGRCKGRTGQCVRDRPRVRDA